LLSTTLVTTRPNAVWLPSEKDPNYATNRDPNAPKTLLTALLIFLVLLDGRGVIAAPLPETAGVGSLTPIATVAFALSDRFDSLLPRKKK
jgi:hypothetical protein